MCIRDRVLDPQIFFEVIQTGRDVRDKRMFLAEYEKYVEMTVIYDKSYRVLLVLMRDITEEEHQRAQKENVRKQTVEITDQVVAKQMRIVQELSLIHILKALLRIAQVYDIPIANNKATADFLITSALMKTEYNHEVVDFKSAVAQRAQTL